MGMRWKSCIHIVQRTVLIYYTGIFITRCFLKALILQKVIWKSKKELDIIRKDFHDWQMFY